MVSAIRNHVDLIIEKLNENIKMNEVIVFGSCAYGMPNNDSDIDLCVIVDEKDLNVRIVTKRIRKIISPIMAYPLDILVYEKADFYERADIESTMEFKILEEGVKVYG